MSLSTYLRHQVGQSPEDYVEISGICQTDNPVFNEGLCPNCDGANPNGKYYNKEICEGFLNNCISHRGLGGFSVKCRDDYAVAYAQWRASLVDAENKRKQNQQKSMHSASMNPITMDKMQAAASSNPITLSQLQARGLSSRPSQPIRRTYPVRGRR